MSQLPSHQYFNPSMPQPSFPSFSGSVLIAHPQLLDPNFRRAVVLLSSHSPQEGAMGVVLNRPLGKKLGELQQPGNHSPLAEVPLYEGGPVHREQVFLTAWKRSADGSAFRLYFGVAQEKLVELMREDPHVHVRGFLGYAGWGEGQLEMELSQRAWVQAPLESSMIGVVPDDTLWETLLMHFMPELLLLGQMPKDPSLN